MLDILNLIDEYKELILQAERHIWANPESGYKEFKTTEYMIEQFEKLGFPLYQTDYCTENFYYEVC